MGVPKMQIKGFWGESYRPTRVDHPDMKVTSWGRGINGKRDHPDVIGNLPICPYGCGREGTLLEIIMEDGRAIGIFNDHPCTCVFRADIEIGEPPTKRKLVIGPDGEMYEEGENK